MRGAFVPICCRAEDFSSAIEIIAKELLEIDLTLNGVDEFYDERFFDGVPSAEMKELLGRLRAYPVQFEDVHYFPADA